ncbi:MAG: helix-turn-helix domain-containing protein [Cyclobacteriaceae bacterium]|nr:helix-turn-helix domain-containing protein [Cyclobacteriaceae bacterium]
MKAIDQSDAIFSMADSFVNQTNCNLFLTGKAGSGKTTFLHYITRHTHKKFVVVAPTGVAAINAGGMTIHSFFQLPPGIYIPEARLTGLQDSLNAVYPQNALLSKIRINKQKRKLIRKLELLIVDEVSMVRADLLDAMDVVLKSVRKNYRQAFGGVQLLMIGDLYQLPPVVTDLDKNLLYRYYETPYFFSARIMKNSVPVRLELEKIHRQQDEKFIGLLNKVRHNQVNDTDLKWLNGFYDLDFRPPSSKKYITLCSHHYKANAINDHELKQLPGKLYRYDADITGEFNESATPADQTLSLKKGAQIMFIKNDMGEEKRYYNGKIGMVAEIDDDEIGITFPGEEGILYIEKETWKNIRYSFDESTGNIIEKELGSFSQFPVRLAWAITIHKSQGLTFERAILDAGDSFTSGQVYVALSRLRSLDGLVLRTRIEKKSIISDWKLQEQHEVQQRDNLQDLLDEERRNYLRDVLVRSMDWELLMDVFREFTEEYKDREVTYREEAVIIGSTCLQKAKELRDIADKFRVQLVILYDAGEQGFPKLSERMEAAYEYFRKNLEEGILDPIKDHYHLMEKKIRMRKYLKHLQVLKQAVATRTMQIRQARDLTAGLAKGEKISGLLGALNETSKKFSHESEKSTKLTKQKKGDSQRMSFQMYRQGKSVEEIARERSLNQGTIESHLLEFIREGELEVFSLVSEEKYGKLLPRIKQNPGRSVSAIKYEFGEQFTYTEIRAVMNYITYLQKDSG